MRVETFKAQNSKKLSELISSRLSLSYNVTQKIIRSKDVKINGKRISSDLVVNENDEITIYYKEVETPMVEILYQDENIIVVFKRRNIETVNENGKIDLLSKVSEITSGTCYAVHRLDRNTEGLVVFALNEKSKNELDLAFKNRTIDKYYLALVFGTFSKSEETLEAYLKKDSKKSLVYISDIPKTGYEKIITHYKVLKEKEDTSLLEVKLITGKTHQIRAHLSHINHFIIGDEKYGDSLVNKKFKKKYQCLCAYKVVFHFDKQSKLSYLNDKEVLLPIEKIDFCQNL